MKYKYSRPYYAFQVALGLALGTAVTLFMLRYFTADDTSFKYKLIITQIIGAGVIIAFGSKSWLNKFVELKENHIHFHSYQDGGTVGNYDVKYENIAEIYVKTLPLIGISRIDLKLKNGDIFEITNKFSRHEEMFCNLAHKLQNDKCVAELPPELKNLINKKTGDGSSS